MSSVTRGDLGAFDPDAAHVGSVIDSAPIGIYIVDHQFRLAYVNRAAAAVLGDGHTEIGGPFDDVVKSIWPPAFADNVISQFRHTLETGEAFAMPEVGQLRIDRQVTEYYEWQLKRIVFADGRPAVVCYFDEISSRVRSRLAIEQSEQRYRTLASVITDVPVTADAEGRFVVPQPAWGGFTGQSWPQMEGFGWLDAVHPDDRSRVAAAWESAVAGRALFEGEVRLWHGPSRQWRHVVGRATPMLGEDGRIREWVGAYTDVHERRQTEAALRDSEERFRAFVMATSDVVYRVSADWSEMRALDGRRFMVDTIAADRDWMNTYVHPDDQPRVRAAVDEAIRTRTPFELEHRVIRVDGTLGWTFSRAVPIVDSRGQIVEWFGTARDVTERHNSDETVAGLRAAAEQHRRLYETILDSTPDLVYVFGRDHRFTYANHALLTMWGKTWHEAIGKNCLELGYEPWHAAMHDREIEEVIATKRPIRGEVPFTGTHGRRIYDYIFVPVFGEDGEVEAIAGTTRDVTDRKRVEDALREDEQRLADANRVKDEFLATLSHELRTPLNAVLGWVHMLSSGTLRPEVQRRAFESIERNAKAQAQLVDDLLDVSRIISGKLPIKAETVDLAVVIASAVEAVRPASEARRLTLDLLVDPKLEILVLGDAGRLQQVLWNLLSNAVKFTAQGGRIAVALQPHGDHVEVSVTDTGEGIEPAFLPYVFERFRQEDSAPSRQHGGLGLGLAIVRHLTEAHGGTVTAESKGHGLGSRFTIRLPVKEVRLKPHAAPAAPEAGAQPIAGCRILVVDDDPDAREMVRALLESRGASVTTSPSAGEALLALKHQPYDALIADIGMPDQDGYSLIAAVRSLPRADGGRIPAIALTAYASLRDRDSALEAGYDWHLGKPVEADRLVATIADAIGCVSRE